MERIVIEVDNQVANAWRNTPLEKRKRIGNELNVRIGKELLNYSKQEYLKFLDDLQEKMKERGLTEEILNDILNER